MQDKIELQKNNLELLNLKIAEIEAQRDSIQEDLQAIRLLAAQRTPKPQWYSLPLANVSALFVISLSVIFVYHNALSNVNYNDQAEESALSLLGSAQIMRGDSLFASDKKLSAQSGKQKIRYTRKKTASQQQWGPLLVMPQPDESKRHYGYDPLVKAQQENLLALGFGLAWESLMASKGHVPGRPLRSSAPCTSRIPLNS